ncbi:hypothetical protein FIBSPDRAFT_1047594 [Athelia psychrophila]|uniref:Uncharacterized protein n=1 Tax=Athelia psychrophila TaxID=1759441 RepID=A0A166F2H2_9AGAM|nr:hypothetical protein FIBSPDRAFT_1047594 [Fibularhizoctonia sp. CBS 109695]
MLDLDLLRSKQPVVTVGEYIQLNGIFAEETSHGSWDRKWYHDRMSSKKGLSLGVIENSIYDPSFANRVDVLPADMKTRGGSRGRRMSGQIGQMRPRPWREDLLESAIVGKTMNNWDGARKMLVGSSYIAGDIRDDALEVSLNENGWEVLYTYNGALNTDDVKNVVWPIRDIVPIHTVRGFREDFSQMTEDAVLLAGETHYERKPGNVRFTTTPGRDFFSHIVSHCVRAPPYVYTLAEKLATYPRKIVNVNWAMEKTFKAHFDRIRNHLSTGHDLLRSLEGGPFEVSAILEATINPNLTHLPPPYEITRSTSPQTSATHTTSTSRFPRGFTPLYTPRT